jgi:hypothetical protein
MRKERAKRKLKKGGKDRLVSHYGTLYPDFLTRGSLFF